jgi:hypothetical protein
MKQLINSLTVALALIGVQAFAQTPTPTTEVTNFIRGDMQIQFKAQTDKGERNVYALNLNVCNSAKFHGKITTTPLKMGGWTGSTVQQNMSLYYDIACDIVNPKNISQTRNVGRIFGNVPVTPDGVYHYSDGTLECSVIPIGNAGGMDSRFDGLALGKPLSRPANWLDTFKGQTVSITRLVGGKTMTVFLKKYDRMEFRQHVLSAGPVATYQKVLVNGEMFYDYDKSTWFMKDMTVQYAVNGTIKIDRVTGTIRWVEDPQRKSNGLGQYEFDVRINEPPPSEESAFNSQPADESAFFQTDNSIPALVGTMKYKDTLNADGDTTSSQVVVDLTGQNISKQQTMVLCKLLLFSAVVPMNSD